MSLPESQWPHTVMEIRIAESEFRQNVAGLTGGGMFLDVKSSAESDIQTFWNESVLLTVTVLIIWHTLELL